jgi:bla regulator protein BlaR1
MNTLEPVFFWMLAASLRASILAVVILGIQFVLRHKLPAAWRHALWLPMLAVLVLPVLPEAPFALLPPKVQSSPVAYLTQEVTQESIPTTFDFTASKMVFASPTDTTAPSVVEKRNVFPLIWLVGTCLVLAAGAVGYIRNMRHIRLNATAPDRALQAAIEEAANKVGLNRAPRTLISPAVASPAVTGLVRPVLLLPARFPEGFSAMESRLILLHEFTHLKRFDLPLNWLLCVLQAMHWFNPLLWFAFARMRADREASCDARVLSLEATDRRSEYGGALLKLQCMTPSRFLSLGFVGIFERGSEIKSRIKGIANHHPARLTWKAAGGAIFALLILFGVTQGQEPESSSDGQESRVEAAAEATEAGSGQDRIPKQLDSIISYFELNSATVEEAFQLLERQTQGVKFVLQLPDSAEVGWSVMNGTQIRRHTMAFENLRLSQIVQAICDRSNLRYTMDEDSVILLPGDKENGGPSVPVPKNSDPQELLQQKMKSLIIPSINFNDATVEEAVQLLNQRSQALDTSEADPAKRGVYFRLLSPGAIAGEPVELPKITLQLQDMPLSAVLQHICDAANLYYSVSDKVVILFPGGKRTVNVGAPKNSPAQELLQQKMNSLIIPTINFNNATVEEAIQFLLQQSQALDTNESDPQKRGVNFALQLPDSADASLKVSMRSQNLPLVAALQSICDAANLQFTVTDQAVVISPRNKANGQPAGAFPESSDAREAMLKKLNSTLRPPSFELNHASIQEALELLHSLSQIIDLASEPDPQKRGVNFVVHTKNPPAGEASELSKITLKFDNVTLAEALQSICDATNLTYTVSDHMVTLSPKAE